jgi:hypothetical protein
MANCNAAETAGFLFLESFGKFLSHITRVRETQEVKRGFAGLLEGYPSKATFDVAGVSLGCYRLWESAKLARRDMLGPRFKIDLVDNGSGKNEFLYVGALLTHDIYVVIDDGQFIVVFGHGYFLSEKVSGSERTERSSLSLPQF